MDPPFCRDCWWAPTCCPLPALPLLLRGKTMAPVPPPGGAPQTGFPFVSAPLPFWVPFHGLPLLGLPADPPVPPIPIAAWHINPVMLTPVLPALVPFWINAGAPGD